jgi:hypothetical protein
MTQCGTSGATGAGVLNSRTASAAGALNAAAAFGVTVGIGEAACVWLAYRRRGLMAPDSEVRHAFADGLAAGLRYARSETTRRSGDRA